MGDFRMYPYKMRIERGQTAIAAVAGSGNFRMYPYKMRIERLAAVVVNSIPHAISECILIK